ncbi:MAG: hypothetical protein AUG48_07265 [Actinobacteria bacterium 13_1_20CM_3_68_9]|nr:MAG: hypothetical protein AUG48_07265 [Actinobacteria bacterium 13_1_20CM_3_68_9]
MTGGEERQRLPLSRTERRRALQCLLDLSEDLDETEAPDHDTVTVLERDGIHSEAHPRPVRAGDRDLQLRMCGAVQLPVEGFSCACAVLTIETDAAVEAAANVADELDRGSVLPPNPPMRIDDVRWDTDRLQQRQRVGGECLAEIRFKNGLRQFHPRDGATTPTILQPDQRTETKVTRA